MKKALFFLASCLTMAGSLQAQIETVWSHSLRFAETDNYSMHYVSQGEDYDVSMNYSPTYGFINFTTSVYTMPAEVEKQNLLFAVNPGITLEHLTLQMGSHEFSDQSDGGPDTESFVLFLGYDIDGVHTECLDTLWNGRNSSMTEHERYKTFVLRNINAKQDIRLYFDCSNSARVTDPQPDQYTGITKAQGMVCVGIRSFFDAPAARYERVTSQSQVEPHGKYMITAVSGNEVYCLAADTASYNNTYLRGKLLPNLKPTDTTYAGHVSVEFEAVPDTSEFATSSDLYFLDLPVRKDSHFALRTSSLGFYLSEENRDYYVETEQIFDPETETSTYKPISRMLYVDLWELRINSDGTLSMISHEMKNQEGRELQYRADRNYFIYQDAFTYEPKLYLWKHISDDVALDRLPAAAPAATCYDLQGRRLLSAPAQGAYIQGGKIINRF